MLEIESLADKYPNIDIVVTSRPDTELFTLLRFDRADLIELAQDDLAPLVQRLMEDQNEANSLVREVIKRRPQIIPLLNTPLMVTLLVISFKTSSEVPTVVSDFYSRLFVTLLNRHDKSKPGGFNRPRKSKLSDLEIQILFNTFSFVALQENLTEMRIARAIELGKKSCKACGIDQEQVEKFFHDVTRITCLLLQEGDIVIYIHKSTQEFHSAEFVADANDENAAIFYKKVREPNNLSRFSVVLEFLEALDTDRFHRNTTLPDTSAFVEHLNSGLELDESKPRDMRIRLFEEIEISVKSDGEFELSLPDMPYYASRWILTKIRENGDVFQIVKSVPVGSYSAKEIIGRGSQTDPRSGRKSKTEKTERERRLLGAIDDVLNGLQERAKKLERMTA